MNFSAPFVVAVSLILGCAPQPSPALRGTAPEPPCPPSSAPLLPPPSTPAEVMRRHEKDLEVKLAELREAASRLVKPDRR